MAGGIGFSDWLDLFVFHLPLCFPNGPPLPWYPTECAYTCNDKSGG